MIYKLNYTSHAINDILLHKKSGNKNLLNKLKKIIVELEIDPFEGIGNPEKLKHDFSGCYSRRLSSKDRLVYKVEENIVYISSAKGQYLDK
jgi:toxin YoeB